MSWVLFALVATFFWAFANIVDKILSTKFLKSPIALVASFGMIGIFFTTSLLVSVDNVFAVPISNMAAALVAGLVIPYAFIPYVKSLSLEETSRVVPLWHFVAIFTLIFATIFLNEVLSVQDYFGFASIFLGGILIATRRIGSVFHLSPAVFLMLFSSLLIGASDTLLKFALYSGMLWQVFSLYYLGISTGSLSLFIAPKVRKAASVALFSHKRNFLIMLFLSVSSGFVGMYFWNAALLDGPVSLVSVFISFQSLFVLIMATVLASRLSLLRDEALDAKAVGMKVVAIALMAAGLLLIAF